MPNPSQFDRLVPVRKGPILLNLKGKLIQRGTMPLCWRRIFVKLASDRALMARELCSLFREMDRGVWLVRNSHSLNADPNLELSGNWAYLDKLGLFGGLALWWMDEVSVEVEFAHKNLMHMVVSNKADLSSWATTFVYGCPTHAGKDRIWDEIRSIGCTDICPWLCIGDFNQVLNVGDKIGGNIPNSSSIKAFQDILNDCGLVDLECKGPRFTWRNNRNADGFIMERIDLAFANLEWREKFDTALVFVETAIGSDHSPLVLNTKFSLNMVRKPFRFESFWTTEEECQRIISESWLKVVEGSNMLRLCKKLRGCKENLKIWHKENFEDMKLKIVALKDQLVGLQKDNKKGFNPDNYVNEKVLITTLGDLWQKESMLWHQRSRVNWLKMGDKNTHFFHLTTIHRRQRNQVTKLKDENGAWQTE
ncbi:hypothetical protein RHSIM_Rhsim08G0119400 [Rhododendron simsii]|uniref:Uncharacterized protein n=1 Tax=Rhododendron simsii TaxID=118357 RepID=A0A834GIR1_RHOSS|nr:hypothetical protein RHSIM_Rhsim08G0119400 [Rhododendron simsii]